MAETDDEAKAGAQQGVQAIEAQILGHFIKDMSFENPGFGKAFTGPGENPNLKVEVNVEARRVNDDLYESGIDFKAMAVNKDGTIYALEVVYMGMFRLRNIPDQALEPFLLINCPTLIFPFLRRLVADVTREGGYPPLLLDPIDFAQLYVRRQREAQANGQSKPN